MKKFCLLLTSMVFSISVFAANLNPYAYGLSSSYDPATFTLTINYSLNAPATSVELVILNESGVEAGRIALPNVSKGTFTEIPVDLSTLGLTGGTYSWRLDVACAKRSSAYESAGRVKTMNSPFSVDVDNNPNSPYFGRIYVAQPTTNETRGIYVYTPGWSKIGDYIDPDIKINTSQSWYTYTHAVPYRIRVVQDGTGRILTTSCDRDQSTHLWYVDPANLTNWTPVVTSSNLNSWTGHGNSSNKFANTALDIRESDDGKNWEILLYSATVNSSTTNYSAGYVYSGIYKVAKTTTNFKGGSYTDLTKATNSGGSLTQHGTIGGTWTGSMVTANAQFDKYGGVLYASYSTGTNPTSPSLIHRRKTDGAFKKDYADGDYLTRQNVATAAIRFNHDHSRLAIAQGAYEKEARFYTVTQGTANEHLSLSDRKSTDMIPSSLDTGSDKAYVIDFAWDYAQNIYAVVRNGSYAIYGVYGMAANLGGKAVSTPAMTKYNFEVDCPDVLYTINVSGQVDNGAINTNLGNCALKIDNTTTSWGTATQRQACTAVTVKATTDDKHKFIGWYDGDTRLTKSEEYSFYAVKNTNLVAKFEFAEYDIKYYHLLADNTGVLGWDMNNENLWALFMAHFNDYNITYKSVTENKIRYAQNIVAALTFIDGTHAINYIQDFMTNEKSQMKWLGDYMLSVASAQGKTISTAKDWRANVCAFFKCESKPTNGEGKYDNSYGTSADFTEYGKPIHWHHYYTEHVSKLKPVISYNVQLATSIMELNPMMEGHDRTPYPTWYNCNVDGKLLAWYYEEDNTKSIVHQVNRSGSLYAIWVSKHIQEKDPDDEASNEDVIKLMKNTNHTTETENLTVTRKLQANMFNTICLPFDLELEGLMDGHPLKGATVMELQPTLTSAYNESGDPVTIINFTEVPIESGKRILHAGVPYLIQPQADVTADMSFTGVARSNLTLNANSVQTAVGDVTITFHGTINPTDIPAGALMLVADNRLAVNTTDQSTMLGMRGYFTIDAEDLASLDDIQEQAEQGRVYLSMKKPVTTSIPVAPEAEQQRKPEVRKIMHNGKIYILRDGRVYDLMGNSLREL